MSNVRSHSVSRARSSLLIVALWLPGALLAQYAEMRPVAAAGFPTVVRQDDRATLVQFGPVRIAFPPGWQVTPSTIGSQARGPTGIATSIMVLEYPGGVSSSLPEPINAISEALKYFCASQTKRRVEVLTQESERSSYVGSCIDAVQTEGSPYTLFYEIRSGNRIVQIISSGTTGFDTARQEQAVVASSVVFE